MALFGKERVDAAVGAGEARTYLHEGSKVMGKLFFEEPVRIDGQVDGEICANEVVIGESAVVTTQLRAASVVIAGKVSGDISGQTGRDSCHRQGLGQPDHASFGGGGRRPV